MIELNLTIFPLKIVEEKNKTSFDEVFLCNKKTYTFKYKLLDLISGGAGEI